MTAEIIIAIFASSGFWALLTAIFNAYAARKTKTAEADSAEKELLLGIAHDKLYQKCSEYIKRGNVTVSEYDNLQYIYKPYKACGGNGTGTKLMETVEGLPIIDDTKGDTSYGKN